MGVTEDKIPIRGRENRDHLTPPKKMVVETSGGYEPPGSKSRPTARNDEPIDPTPVETESDRLLVPERYSA